MISSSMQSDAKWVQVAAALDQKLMQSSGAAPICLGLIRERDLEIHLLRRDLVRYGDKSRMATVEPMELQQVIDRAFEAQP